jgi:hypothetical protein
MSQGRLAKGVVAISRATRAGRNRFRASLSAPFCDSLIAATDQPRGGDQMGSKDKGGANTKKQAQHNLKEKRQAKKAKKSSK